MNRWNIIAPKYFTDMLKDSKYYTLDMGNSLTGDAGGNKGREMRKGEFATWYYTNFKSLLFKQGNIGKGLSFYIDYYLKEDIVGFFMEHKESEHQYAITIEYDVLKDLGIDDWLGTKLEEIEKELKIDKNQVLEKINTSTTGDADKLKNNPGGVTWDDIKEHYQRKKNKMS